MQKRERTYSSFNSYIISRNKKKEIDSIPFNDQTFFI